MIEFSILIEEIPSAMRVRPICPLDAGIDGLATYALEKVIIGPREIRLDLCLVVGEDLGSTMQWHLKKDVLKLMRRHLRLIGDGYPLPLLCVNEFCQRLHIGAYLIDCIAERCIEHKSFLLVGVFIGIAIARMIIA